MLSVANEKQLQQGGEFGELASEEQIERTVQALKANGIEALVAENAEEARRIVF